MQLKYLMLTYIFIFCSNIFGQEVKIQKPVDDEVSESSRQKINVEILFNYYDQDGDHSPVTGGQGTEEQTVLAPTILINMPIKENHNLSMDIGLDNITSASTDRIDGTKSSASENDTRVHGNLWYDYNFDENKQSVGVMLGFSKEYDVLSLQGGARYSLNSDDENKQFSVSFVMFQDKWDLIYPIEFRPFADTLLEDDTRSTYDLKFDYSQVITQKLQASVTAEIIHQEGLLSTPFHRVFFDDSTSDIERLPDTRTKFATGLRFHYFWNDYLISRVFYRYYWDDFQISGNTIELELPIRVKPNLTLTPLLRYHTQTRSEHFQKYGEHSPGSEFHTSDYDLSDFSSYQAGLQIHYRFIDGNFLKHFNIDSIDFHYNYYDREDGLTANSISLGFSFSF